MPSGSAASGPHRTSVWLDERPSAKREPRAGSQEAQGLDRAKITTATVRLLDSDGMAKFSMRRLAAELGVTAMSLYWYVNSKDELLELALDRVQGEVDLPTRVSEEEGDARGEGVDWRADVRQLATSYRAMLVNHPWVSATIGQYMNIGPCAMDFARSAQDVLGRAGLSPTKLTGALSAVFQFTYGFATVEANWNARCSASGLTSDELYQEVLAKATGRPEYTDSLELRESADAGTTVDELRQQDFDNALDLLVAGIEVMRDAD